MKRSVLLIVCLTLWSCAGGCSPNPATGKSQLCLMSVEDELEAGNRMTPSTERMLGGAVKNKDLQDYMEQVGRKIADKCDRRMPYKFTLVATLEPNAFAVPNGQVFLTAGLFVAMENERQMAAVLGHEVAHVCARHWATKTQWSGAGKAVVGVVSELYKGQGSDLAKQAAKLAVDLLNFRYSRQKEYEADKYGIEYMTRAGYNPCGAVELLTLLEGLSKVDKTEWEEMFMTHPLTPKRIEEAREIVVAQHSDFSADQPDPDAARFLKMRNSLRQMIHDAKGSKAFRDHPPRQKPPVDEKREQDAGNDKPANGEPSSREPSSREPAGGEPSSKEPAGDEPSSKEPS